MSGKRQSGRAGRVEKETAEHGQAAGYIKQAAVSPTGLMDFTMLLAYQYYFNSNIRF